VIARAELRAKVAQERNRGGTFEVADTRSEEEDEARRGVGAPWGGEPAIWASRAARGR
jgi:hypothetical protein